MKKFIIKSNQWYENSPDYVELLFILFFVCVYSFLIDSYPITVSIIVLIPIIWRLAYKFIKPETVYDGELEEVETVLPVSEVVFFECKDGKYVASNGIEVTADFLLKHNHHINGDFGYLIIEENSYDLEVD
jgi:hypothetical protein